MGSHLLRPPRFPRLLLLPLLAGLLLPHASRAGERAPSAPPREGCPRVFVVLVDAVPFDVAEGAMTPTAQGGPGLFSDFYGPWPVISTFPSSTSIAMGAIFDPLGLDPSPGYQARFYDAEAGKVRGGGLFSYRKIVFPWRDGFFHWKTEGTLRKAIGYARPLRFGRKEARQALQAFLASDEPLFVAYMTSTDAAAHLKGPDGLAQVLGDLHTAIREAQRSAPEPFFTVVLSDHGVDGVENADRKMGFEPLRNTFRPIRKALKGAGFQPGKKARQPGRVAIIALGLLSSVGFGTYPGEEGEVARALAALPGIDLCTAPLPPLEGVERWRVEGGVGDRWGGATLLYKPDPAGGEGRWRYVPEDGDPLGYGDLAEGGFQPDSWWWQATHDRPFPDALHRIHGAFTGVENPASLVCSIARGWMFGPPFTAFTSKITTGALRWTHGALEWQGSAGFLLTDIPHWVSDSEPPALRADQSLAPLAPLLQLGTSCPLPPTE